MIVYIIIALIIDPYKGGLNMFSLLNILIFFRPFKTFFNWTRCWTPI